MRRQWAGSFVFIGVCAIAVSACKKESTAEKDTSATPTAEPKESAGKVRTTIARTPAIDLAPAAPDGDRFTILFRFDHLRVHGFAPAAESIIAPLPDYRRVFGARELQDHGDLIGDIFETVILTTSDPTVLTATTLAARGPFKPEALRATLAYPESGVAWSQAAGGPLGTISPTTRFGWGGPRVFLMPAPGWIILADAADLKDLTSRASATPIDRVRPPTATDMRSWPAWLRQVPETDKQSRLSRKDLGDLLVVASIRGLAAMNLPSRIGQFEVPTPRDITIAAFAKTGGVSFHGTMRFAEAATAKTFVEVASAAKLALAMKEVERSLPAGSLEPLRKLRFHQDGRVVRWVTTATKEETIQMCAFSAKQAARLMGTQP